MDMSTRSKWQIRAAALIVFLLGFTAGALALNGYQRWARTRTTVDRQGRFEQMLDSLQLNAEQKTQVHQILAETREQLRGVRRETEPRYDEIRKQADERLQKVMTADQWQKFQQARSEMRNRGGRRGGRGGPER